MRIFEENGLVVASNGNGNAGNKSTSSCESVGNASFNASASSGESVRNASFNASASCFGNKGSGVVIDGFGNVNGNAVITHAHSDHSRISKKSKAKILASRETRELLAEKLKGMQVKGTSFSRKVSLEDFDLRLESSGHMLGSSQVLIKGEKNVTVTSDLQLQESLFLKPAKVHKCDVLVIESTFGLPSFQFPERNQVFEEIGEWVKENTAKKKFCVLAGYSMGKAQELVRIVNEFAGETPLVHESIFKNCKVYEKMGARLGKFELLNHNLKDFNVLIIPPSLASGELLQALSISAKRKIASAVATGWNFKRCFDKVFHLSDHADYNQLMHYVKESEARLVITHHGFEREFAKSVKRKLGVQAFPLSKAGQTSMAEFC